MSVENGGVDVASLNLLQKEIQNINEKMNEIILSNRGLKKEIIELTVENNNLYDSLYDIEIQLSNLDQYSRRSNKEENKEVYICGDYNFDLLKVDTDHLTRHFFNLLCSYGFLPHILQPTRVTENTSTVIDNIFSNNIQDDIISGNVLLNLSDHFAQMVSVNR